MEINHSTGNKMPSQEHLNFINKLNDAKIPRQSQLIANRLFMKNFPREVNEINIIIFIHLSSFRQLVQKLKLAFKHSGLYMM